MQTHRTAFDAQWPLAAGINSRLVDNGNGLQMQLLEAGNTGPDAPLLLLLHGFPELSYSWRHVILPLADAGYHVVAPDQRGYGLTTGWQGEFDDPVLPFGMLNLVRDILGLVSALGKREVACVVGHDFGSAVAGFCALMRPDVFKKVALMSAPFPGAPGLGPLSLARDYPTAADTPPSPRELDTALAGLPEPRLHYHSFYSTRDADPDMRNAPQGVHAFMRAYYHYKSADWAGNKPVRLASWAPEQMATMPTYYIMNAGIGMAESVAPMMPDAASISACQWLTDEELAVYSRCFEATGFQGGLNWYRCRTVAEANHQLQLFAGRTIDVPAIFTSGQSDWGVYQRPGELERMRDIVCPHMQPVRLIPGAGHWVQQEQPDAVVAQLQRFLAGHQ